MRLATIDELVAGLKFCHATRSAATWTSICGNSDSHLNGPPYKYVNCPRCLAMLAAESTAKDRP